MYVYAIDATAYQATILKMPIHGGTSVPFVQTGVNNTMFNALATDGVNLFWAFDGTPSMNWADAGIYKMALTGGAPTQIASASTAGNTGNIGTDGSYVYYFESGSPATFARVALGGGTPQPIASANQGNVQNVSRPIRFDDHCVYWSDTFVSAYRRIP